MTGKLDKFASHTESGNSFVVNKKITFLLTNFLLK